MPIFLFPVFPTETATWAVLSEQREPFAAAFLPIKRIFCPRCGRSISSLSLWHSKRIPRLCLPSMFGAALGKHFHCEHSVLLVMTWEEHFALVRTFVTIQVPEGTGVGIQAIRRSVCRALPS